MGGHSFSAYLSNTTICRIRRFRSGASEGYPGPSRRATIRDLASGLRRIALLGTRVNKAPAGHRASGRGPMEADLTTGSLLVPKRMLDCGPKRPRFGLTRAYSWGLSKPGSDKPAPHILSQQTTVTAICSVVGPRANRYGDQHQ